MGIARLGWGERDRRRAVVGAACAGAALLGLGIRNERALFILDGPAGAVFAAVEQLVEPIYSYFTGFGAGFGGAPGGRGGPITTGRPGLPQVRPAGLPFASPSIPVLVPVVPTGPGLAGGFPVPLGLGAPPIAAGGPPGIGAIPSIDGLTPGIGGPIGAVSPPGTGTPGTGTPPSTGTPGTPGTGTPGTGTPGTGTPGTGAPGTGTPGTGTPPGGGTPTNPPPAIIPAVPEPGTWAMMMLGMMAIGATLRRARRRGGPSAQYQAVSVQGDAA